MENAEHQNATAHTALIAGATGLVGSALVRELLASDRYQKVISLGRRALDIENPKLQNEVVDLGKLDEKADKWAPNDIFCCLGTTIKKAGSQAQFRKVDYEYVMNVAKLAAASGAQRFLVVSAVGADPDSRVFYSRTKGEVEHDLRGLSIPQMCIFRPSLLLGDRKEFRFGERLAAGLMLLARPFFRGGWAKYHPISANRVAQAMYRAAGQKKEGIHVYEYPQITDLVNSGS